MDIFPSDITQIINNYDYAINYEGLTKMNKELKKEHSETIFWCSIPEECHSDWARSYFHLLKIKNSITYIRIGG